MSLAKWLLPCQKKPFMKWVGPMELACKHTRNKYILVTIDYATKWVEAKTL
jgi:hypothetical protein